MTEARGTAGPIQPDGEASWQLTSEALFGARFEGTNLLASPVRITATLM